MEAGNNRLWAIAAIVSMSCAVVVTAILIRREWFPPEAPGAFGPPVAISNWEDLLGEGHRLGATSPSVTMVIFGDFECPFCRKFTAEVLQPFLRDHPAEVQVVHRHLPLPYHANALMAARALECGARQGAFEAMYFGLYENQDSLGERPLDRFAESAGVPDLVAFDDCVQTGEALPEVARDSILAESSGVRATPTVIVNGKRFGQPPRRQQLDSVVASTRRARRE